MFGPPSTGSIAFRDPDSGDKRNTFQKHFQSHCSPIAPSSRPLSMAAEADEESKFRQLPCRTFIAVGTCPFRDRCVYLHDPRLLCKEAKTKTRKKNRDDSVTDSLFWPAMDKHDVRKRLDQAQGQGRHSQNQHQNQLQPHVIQPYHVPIPFDSFPRQTNLVQIPSCVLNTNTGNNTDGTGFGKFHDRCLYSLWMHFADYCGTLNGNPSVYAAAAEGDGGTNRYLGSRRLPVFVALAGAGGEEEEGTDSAPSTAKAEASPSVEVSERSRSSTDEEIFQINLQHGQERPTSDGPPSFKGPGKHPDALGPSESPTAIMGGPFSLDVSTAYAGAGAGMSAKPAHFLSSLPPAGAPHHAAPSPPRMWGGPRNAHY